jgi:hypothetical protein
MDKRTVVGVSRQQAAGRSLAGLGKELILASITVFD